MEKLKQIDDFLSLFPKVALQDPDNVPMNNNTQKIIQSNLNKNPNGKKAETMKEINQRVNEKMSKINGRTKKEKRRRQRGGNKINKDEKKTQPKNGK
jgi:hypothetical protein